MSVAGGFVKVSGVSFKLKVNNKSEEGFIQDFNAKQ